MQARKDDVMSHCMIGSGQRIVIQESEVLCLGTVDFAYTCEYVWSVEHVFALG